MSLSREKFSSASEKLRRHREVVKRSRLLSDKGKLKVEEFQENEERYVRANVTAGGKHGLFNIS